MFRRALGGLALLALAAGLWIGQTTWADAPATTATAPNRAATPVWRPDNGGNWWNKIHEEHMELLKKGDIDLYFDGDSITEGWQFNQPLWQKSFGGWKPANFAIRGDQTQHVLWRLQAGEFTGLKPKGFVLMVGTNNSGNTTPEETAGGIEAIVKEVHKQSPTTKILLLAIFPRGADAKDPKRIDNQAVNAIISKLDDGRTVKYLDIGSKFLEADGTPIKGAMAPDNLHLAYKGYEIWAEAIVPALKEMLGAPAAPATQPK